MIVLQLTEENLECIITKAVDKAISKIPRQPVIEKPLSLEEAAEFLRLRPQTVYQKISSIPHSKVGKILLFKHEDLLRYIEDNRRKTSTEIINYSEEYLGKCKAKKYAR